MKKLFAAIITLFATLAVFAQSVQPKGFLPDKARVNTPVNYVLDIVNADADVNIDALNAKVPQGLRYLGRSASTSMSFSTSPTMGVKREKRRTVTLTFAAEKEGSYTIGEWTLKIGDKEFKVPPSTLVVDNNAPVSQNYADDEYIDPIAAISSMGQSMQSLVFGNGGGRSAQRQRVQRKAPDLSKILSANIEINTANKDKKIYVGESVPCKIVLKIDRQLAQQEGLSLSSVALLPEKTNDFTAQITTQKPVLSEESNLQYVSVEYSAVITPNKVGTFPLSYAFNGEFAAQMRPQDAFLMDIFEMATMQRRALPFKINAEIKALKVEPLPQNAPATFTGAIGTFSIEKAVLNPSSTSVGEPSTFSYVIAGTGNFGRIEPAQIKSDENWKVYKPKSKFSDESDGAGYIGSKTFEYITVPLKADLESFIPFEFTFFNPEKGEYQTLKCPKVEASVAPAKSQTQAATIKDNSQTPKITKTGEFDIVPAKDASASSIALFARAEFWIFQAFIIIAVIAAIVLRRKSLKLKENPMLAKFVAEKKTAKEKLKKAELFAKEGNVMEFLKEGKESLQYALAASTAKEPLSVLEKDAQYILQRDSLSEFSQTVSLLFSGQDAVRYGEKSERDFDLPTLERSLKALCKELLR